MTPMTLALNVIDFLKSRRLFFFQQQEAVATVATSTLHGQSLVEKRFGTIELHFDRALHALLHP
jgi:hypothetical protein